MFYQCGKHGHFIIELSEAMEVKPEHKHRPRTDHKHHLRDDYKGKNKSERRPRKGGGQKKKQRAMVAGASDINSSSCYSSSSSSDEDENRHKGNRWSKNINSLCFATQGFCGMALLTVNSCIKVCLDLQADKSPVIVKGPFFPRVVNPMYQIRGTNV
jgi:hypothetical protein